jgi:hypothetical protein
MEHAMADRSTFADFPSGVDAVFSRREQRRIPVAIACGCKPRHGRPSNAPASVILPARSRQ